MATLTRFSGAETDTASAAGTGFFDSITGTVARSTSSPMHGVGCWEMSLSASANSAFAWTVSGTAIVGVGYFKLLSDATPAADLRLFEGRTTDGVTNRYCRLGVDTSGLIFADVYDGGSTAKQTAAGAISADTWYRVEFRMICNAGGSSNTFTIDWATAAGDAAATTQTQVSSVEGTGNSFDEFRCGPAVAGTTITHTVHIDSVVLSATSGDYPLGPAKVLGYSPDGVGTHNLDAATSEFFFQNSGSDTALTTSETTSYQQIDDSPLDADTNHLKVTLGRGVTSVDSTQIVTRGGTTTNTGASSSGTGAPTAGEVAVTDGSPGFNSLRFMGKYYGGAAPLAAGANSTAGPSIDLGAFGCAAYRETTAGQGSRNVGSASGTDDTGHVALAVKSSVGNVAYDAQSESHTGTTGHSGSTTYSWTHGGTAQARAAVVFVFTIAGSPVESGVTYGGAAMTQLYSGFDTDTEPGGVRAYFLDGIARGSQTVEVTRTNNATVSYAICFTVTCNISPTNTWYTEHTFANSGESTDPLAVRALIAQRNDSGTTANSITAKLRANSNESNIFSGDIGSATRVFKSAYFTTAPGGAAWTDTILDGSTLRWGYTNDVDSTPRLEAAALEAVFAVISSNTYTKTGFGREGA